MISKTGPPPVCPTQIATAFSGRLQIRALDTQGNGKHTSGIILQYGGPHGSPTLKGAKWGNDVEEGMVIRLSSFRTAESSVWRSSCPVTTSVRGIAPRRTEAVCETSSISIEAGCGRPSKGAEAGCGISSMKVAGGCKIFSMRREAVCELSPRRGESGCGISSMRIDTGSGSNLLLLVDPVHAWNQGHRTSCQGEYGRIEMPCILERTWTN